MANWFKIYETDLDEKRLKYAMSKVPETGWVFIGILSECCKHRSDTIRWSEDEVDLFGFSDALKVSIPKVNAAVSLLCDIQYIERSPGFIKVLKWNEKQSEYNHRKQRGDYRILSESVGESPLDERRGEERREIANRGNGALESVKMNGKGRTSVELMEKCRELFGEDEMRKRHKRWSDRAFTDSGKLDRVLADTSNAVTERRISTTPARYAEDTWKRFR